jgi:hypothetical protein
MKKIINIVAGLLCFAVVCGATVVYLDYRNSQIYWADMPSNTNENLKYFGYYHFSGDRVQEVASFGHSNMCKIDGDDTQGVLELINNGFQVFIMIRHMFFRGGDLREDWQSRWEAVKTVIDAHYDSILGFYVDEPVRRNLTSDENVGKSMEAFHFACRKVLEDYPAKRMMSVMTLDDVQHKDYSREYYRYCTDLAYDYYPRWDRESVLENISILENEIAVNNQDIWLIPKAFYTVDSNGGDLYWLIEDRSLPIGQDVLDWIKGSYEIAVADKRIVGLFCFVYDNDGFTVPLRKFFLKESEYYNEEVFGVYNQIGRAIIANDK